MWSQALFLEPKVGPKWDPNRIFDAEALRTPLESLLERSWKPQEPKRRSWERLLAGLGPKRGPKRGPKWHPKTVQDACMRPRRSKKAPRGLWGAILTPPGPLGTSKTAVLRIKFPCFEGATGACQEHSARHPRAFQDMLRQACCVKSIPRYSKTSRPGPPSENASRDASRSASLDVPEQASKGWAAVPRRRRLQ